jgi:hypothetical protein
MLAFAMIYYAAKTNESTVFVALEVVRYALMIIERSDLDGMGRAVISACWAINNCLVTVDGLANEIARMDGAIDLLKGLGFSGTFEQRCATAWILLTLATRGVLSAVERSDVKQIVGLLEDTTDHDLVAHIVESLKYVFDMQERDRPDGKAIVDHFSDFRGFEIVMEKMGDMAEDGKLVEMMDTFYDQFNDVMVDLHMD